MLQQGAALHQRGQLLDAKALYESVLRREPNHFDALHLLGVIAWQTKDFETAEKLIGRAIKLKPDNAPANFNLGNVFYDQMRLEEALASYERAIVLNPLYVEAYNHRAIVLGDMKRVNEALASYDRAIELRPSYAEARRNRDIALRLRGSLDEAIAAAERAVAQSPNDAQTHFDLGVALLKAMRLEEALSSYDRAIALSPEFSDAHNGRADVLRERGRFDDALASYDRAIALRPDFFAAHLHRGEILSAMKRPAEALLSFEAAIALNPASPQAHNERGNALRDLNRRVEAHASHRKAMALKHFNDGVALMERERPAEALASFDRAIELDSGNAAAHVKRGLVLARLERWDEALKGFDRAIALQPDDVGSYSNRGHALLELGRPEEALADYDRVIARKPELAEAHASRAAALMELMRLQDAVASCDKAIELKPDFAEAISNRGHFHLLRGDFKRGWQDFEWRRLTKEPLGTRAFAQPLWRGDADLSGKTILVHWERGLGDTIQFCRYVPLLAERGARVLFAPQKPLRALLCELGKFCEIVDEDDRKLEFSFHCPLLSLPLAFGTTIETIPNKTPYLRADPGKVSRWAAKIGNDGFKIGICWQRSTGTIDWKRSFPLVQFEAISRIPNVRLISLQKGEGVAQVGKLPIGMHVEDLGPDFDAGQDAFMDTAALIEHCDLVISSDTAVAHLAGALGAQTWVALKQTPDWRWMMDRADSPWYPTLRLFRQSVRYDWKGVFEEIERALNVLMRRGQ